MSDFKIYLKYFVFSAEAFSGYRVKRQDSDDDYEKKSVQRLEQKLEIGFVFKPAKTTVGT